MSIVIVVFFVTISPNRCYHDRRSLLDWCRGWGACEPKRIRSKPDGKTHIDPAFVSSRLAGLESSRQFHGCQLSRHPPNAIYKCLALWMFLKRKDFVVYMFQMTWRQPTCSSNTRTAVNNDWRPARMSRPCVAKLSHHLGLLLADAL